MLFLGGFTLMIAIGFLKWTRRIFTKKYAFISLIVLAIVIFVMLSNSYLCNRRLVNRGEVVKPSQTGNLMIVLWNRSPRTPYAKILVEVRNAISLRRLYYGVMPFPDQNPGETGGDFDGHYREFHSYDLPSGTYDVIVHELRTKTVAVQTVNVPRKGKWVLQINFDNASTDIFSPFPYFSIEQGTEVKSIL
jgi:hypothetical protein